MSTESVMPSNHLILYHPLLLRLQSLPASGSFQMSHFFTLAKYWSFTVSINPSSKYSGLISFQIDWLDRLQSKELSILDPRERQIFYVKSLSVPLYVSAWVCIHFSCTSKKGIRNFPEIVFLI